MEDKIINFKSKIFSACMGFSLALCVGFSAQLHAHGNRTDPNEPKKPPPPPPPCQNWVTIDWIVEKTILVGDPGCKKEETFEFKEGRTVCADKGSGGNVSYRTGYESFVREDLVVNGIYPIEIKRQYMSNSTYDSPLGYGWSFNHDLRLFEYPDGSVIVRTGCGVNYKFLYTGGNAYQAEVGTDVLTKNSSDNSFDLTYLNSARDHFDSQGRLTEAWDTKGNRLEYLYSAEKMSLMGSSPYGVDKARPITVAYVYQLEKIRERLASESLSGNYVDFTYSVTTGRLTGIASNDGRTVAYVHDDAGGGNTKGNLLQVNGLEGEVSNYKYEDVLDINVSPLVFKDHHNITEIKHSTASEPIILEYDVAAEDRVIKETIGFQEFTYDWTASPLRTTVTEKITDDVGLTPVLAVREYAFDANGYISELKNGFGHKITYTNDANGNSTLILFEENTGTLASPVYAEVRTINATFATNGDKLTENITLDSGEVHSFTWAYDQTRLTVKTAASSAPGSSLVKTENVFNHDIEGKPSTLRAKKRYLDNGIDYLETRYTYNEIGNVLTTTLPDDHVIANEYGAAYAERYVTKMYHKVAGVTVPDLEETYEYDTMGNRTKVTDARGNETTTTYDDKNRRLTITNAKNHLTTFMYDVNDNLTQINRDRDAASDQLDKTRLTYDSKNQLTQIDRTNSANVFVMRSTMRYDSAGNVIARGDAFGNETLLSYDLENRLTRITDAEGNYMQYTLNALGHRITTAYYESGGNLVRTSSAVFDDLNRQEQIIGAIGQTTTFTYDVQGNRITATDALNRPTTIYSYDTLSRLTNINDANGKDTVYQYDDRDQLRFVTDPVSLATEYQYNELGQLTKLISPDTGTTEYSYDLAGNRKTQKDARNITVTFGYDALNRIISKTYPDTSLNVTYAYDTCTNGIGKLCSMQDKEGNTTYGYDERGNLISRSRTATAGGQTYLTQYGYDLNDRMISTTYPSGRVVIYNRNTLGQVNSVTTTPNGGSPQPIASNLSYLPFGAMEDIDWGNGLSLDQTFDSDYRLTDQVLGTTYSRTYGYDGVNNIKSINDNTPADKDQSFNYDVLDRLDDATGNYGDLDYAYDDVGNRINLTVDSGTPTVYNYGASANQLDNTTGTQAHSFTYDANGNTKTKDTATFTYDDMNRLSQVNDGAATTSYGFNGKGERTKNVTSTGTTLYHYDSSGNLLFESDAVGNTNVEYIWLGNQRLAMVQSGSLYYTHTDHLGTVQLLTDNTGNVVWSADYKPFGEVTITNSTVTNNLRAPGQYFDAESGLHQNYFRDYDPSIGRYAQSDPLGILPGLSNKPSLQLPWNIKRRLAIMGLAGSTFNGLNHPYLYVKGNPLAIIDPYGLAPSCSYYDTRCNEDGGDYYCDAAPGLCGSDNWPDNDWTDCSRKCLQKKDKQCDTTPGQCSNEGINTKCNVRIHLECWIECS